MDAQGTIAADGGVKQVGVGLAGRLDHRAIGQHHLQGAHGVACLSPIPIRTFS
jgi:hypothetical protein